MPQQFNINVDLNSLTPRKCHCGSGTFMPVVNFYDVPAILSPTGQADIVAIGAGYVCLACQAPAILDVITNGDKSRLVCLEGGK